MKTSHWKVAGLLILVIVVFVYGWPTPWEYTRKAPDVWRVNRFTGVTEVSSDIGWISQSQWERKRKVAIVAAEEAKELEVIDRMLIEAILDTDRLKLYQKLVRERPRAERLPYAKRVIRIESMGKGTGADN